MASFILRRLLQLPLILAVIFIITFTLAWLVPGDPLSQPDARRPPEEVQEAMRRQYNLHSPWAFAGSYLKNLAMGDLGPSLQYRDQTVNDLIGSALPVSITLGAAALMVGLALGLVAGIAGAVRPGSVLDLSSLAVALVGISLPSFITGSILLVVFAGMWHLAPIGAWEWPGVRVWTGQWWGDVFEMSKYLVLPAITLGVAPAAYIARLIRLGLTDVMGSDYIRTARAKGVAEHQILFKHALKVAFLPVLSFLGPAAAAVMTGSFVVEKVFAIPGMGEHFVNAVLNKDQFLILGVVLVYATMLIMFNLIVDVAYAWVDPRIQLA